MDWLVMTVIEWLLFLFPLIIALIYWMVREYRRHQPVSSVTLRIRKATASLGSKDIHLSFQVNRKDLEKLLGQPASFGLIHKRVAKLRRFKKREKPECFGELKTGLPEKDECAECVWRDTC